MILRGIRTSSAMNGKPRASGDDPWWRTLACCGLGKPRASGDDPSSASKKILVSS